MLRDDAPPPGGSWRAWYAAVLALLAVFTRVFR